MFDTAVLIGRFQPVHSGHLALLHAALAQARNFAAECKAQRIWDSKQAVYKRALARHSPERWQRFLSDAGRVDRISKGRVRLGQETTDAWQQLERLLLAVADKGALRLLAS